VNLAEILILAKRFPGSSAIGFQISGNEAFVPDWPKTVLVRPDGAPPARLATSLRTDGTFLFQDGRCTEQTL
jgi:hypothetical protein